MKYDQDKVRNIHSKLLAVQSRKKRYADNKVKYIEFQMSDNVLLKISPMNGAMKFVKMDHLSTYYIGPFDILERIGPVAYRLALPQNLYGVHPIYQVSMLKRYNTDDDNRI